MGELGILKTSDRVELLEGLLVQKMTHNPPHDATVSLVEDELRSRLPAGWILRVQSVITTADSAPEPDVAVVRGPRRRYARAHPTAPDIAFLVEVADTSLEEDRTEMHRLYARARIPIYWIVNIPGSCIEVYTRPLAGRSPRYRQQRVYTRDEEVPVIIEGQEVARVPVRNLLL
jgi:Uma2 family endonuclease